jgi:hypothetical protein
MTQGFAQARGNWREAHVFVAMNRGSLSCPPDAPVTPSPRLRADLAAEEYAEIAGTTEVTRRAWTPRSIALDVDAKTPARILVNQSYARGWSAGAGQVVDAGGVLAVDVPAGKSVVTLEYDDALSTASFLVSLATALGMLGLLARGGAREAAATFGLWRDLGAFAPFRDDDVDDDAKKRKKTKKKRSDAERADDDAADAKTGDAKTDETNTGDAEDPE